MAAIRGLGFLAVALVASGCGTTAPSFSASSSPSATGPAALGANNGGTATTISPGAYTTTAAGFHPGLGLTVPDGWELQQNNAAELKLTPQGKANDILELWEDVVAVEPNNQNGAVGQAIAETGHTASDLITFLTTTKDFDVFESPKDVTLGTSVHATRLSLGVSASADFAEPECPDNPHCAAIAKSPIWGPNEFWAIGGDEVATIYIVAVGDSTFWITLDAPAKDELAVLQTAADPILASLSLP